MKDKAMYHPTIVPRYRSSIWRLLLSLLLTANWAYAAPQLSLQQIFKENAPAIVVIRLMDATGKQLALGSGFVVSPSGVIVTNHHVIEPKPGARLVVKLPNGDTYEDVWVIHDEERRDLAVLSIKAAGLPTVKVGDSDKVEVGEQVVAIGHPKGLEMTFTVGIVSAIRPMPGKGYRFIQHQTPISPGSSGGPLLNMNGEVVGINTFGFEGGQNLNGAVPVNYVKAFLQDPPKMTYEQYARSRGVPTPEERKPSPPASTALRTYRNEKHGFSFKYPQVWDATKQQDSREHESGVEWFFQHAKVERFGRDIFRLTVRPLPWSKEGASLDLAKAVETHFKSRFGEWKDSATGFSVRPTDLIDGEGYRGYYFAYYSPLLKEMELDITGTIYTKSFVYELFAACPHPAEHADFKHAVVKIIKSLEFAKARSLPSPPSVVWKTYRNDKYGVSFEYPEYWRFEEVGPQVMEVRKQFGDRLVVWGDVRLSDSVPGIELGESSYAKLEVVVKDTKESDFEKAARQDYEKQATSQFPKTISNEVLGGNGYAATYWIYRHVGAPYDSVEIKIYTKAFVYVLEGYASNPSVGSYYRWLIKKVFESLKFPT